MKKYAVLLVAGQSNAVGYDESVVLEEEARTHSRIFQLGFRGENNLKVIPLTHCAENFQDMRDYTNPENKTEVKGTKGLHLPLSKLLIDKLPEDMDILVLPCAYGGRGFLDGTVGTYDRETMRPSTDSNWGKESALYRAMKDRLEKVLKENEENKFIGTIWIQGENDARDSKTHWKKFEEMVTDFFEFFNNRGYGKRVKKGIFDKDCWFNVETVAHWYGIGECKEIWNNYRKWNEKTYIEIPRDTDSNCINGMLTTDTIGDSHFGNNSYTTVIAPRIYEKLIRNL